MVFLLFPFADSVSTDEAKKAKREIEDLRKRDSESEGSVGAMCRSGGNGEADPQEKEDSQDDEKDL